MASYVELYLDQGTTFLNTINITDDVTSNVANISGYTFSSQMRKSYYSINATANIVCTITNAANGEVRMSLAAANTALIKPGKYLFDVVMIDTANLVSRLIEGTIIIAPGVSR